MTRLLGKGEVLNKSVALMIQVASGETGLTAKWRDKATTEGRHVVGDGMAGRRST